MTKSHVRFLLFMFKHLNIGYLLSMNGNTEKQNRINKPIAVIISVFMFITAFIALPAFGADNSESAHLRGDAKVSKADLDIDELISAGVLTEDVYTPALSDQIGAAEANTVLRALYRFWDGEDATELPVFEDKTFVNDIGIMVTGVPYGDVKSALTVAARLVFNLPPYVYMTDSPQDVPTREEFYLMISDAAYTYSIEKMMPFTPQLTTPEALTLEDEEFYGRDVFLFWSGDKIFKDYSVEIYDEEGELLKAFPVKGKSFNLTEDSTPSYTDVFGKKEKTVRAFYSVITLGRHGLKSAPGELRSFTSYKYNSIVERSKAEGGITMPTYADGDNSIESASMKSEREKIADKAAKAAEKKQSKAEKKQNKADKAKNKAEKAKAKSAVKEAIQKINAKIAALDKSGEAADNAHQTTISLKLWRYEDDKKVPWTTKMRLNKALTDDVEQIFKEIYRGKEKFPIYDIGSFSKRDHKSEHNYGMAIDINPNENYMIGGGDATVGSFWNPEKSEYSIPADGDVVKAFKRHGWGWGGDWHSKKDYMHFSYMGT
jgi:hypothetical protein